MLEFLAKVDAISFATSFSVSEVLFPDIMCWMGSLCVPLSFFII